LVEPIRNVLDIELPYQVGNMKNLNISQRRGSNYMTPTKAGTGNLCDPPTAKIM